jgi:hypothetical protein
MRPREHATEKCIAEKRERYRTCQQRNIVQLAAQRRASEDADQQEHGNQRSGYVNQIDFSEIEFPMLLVSSSHCCDFPRQKAFYNSVGVEEKIVGAFAGCHGNKLHGSGLDSGL